MAITTEKTEYEQGEVVKITVENNLDKDICFESCNTNYSVKKNNSSWERILFKFCETTFITECVGPEETKIFEETLYPGDYKGEGIHRVAVPIYTGCQNKEWPCEEIKTIYSNEFTIN